MQFGKTAAALASLLAAGTCAAAGVKVYGAIDTGLTYKHVAESGGNSLEMTSGNFAGSRLGLKCSEDLGNGLSVGFILENGSSSDSGALGKDGSIFNRESQIYLKTRFGTSRLAENLTVEPIGRHLGERAGAKRCLLSGTRRLEGGRRIVFHNQLPHGRENHPGPVIVHGAHVGPRAFGKPEAVAKRMKPIDG